MDPRLIHTNDQRTLVLCFDGTGNSFADENTNVIRFFSALDKRKRHKQLCYYQPGIGTYVSPTVIWAGVFRGISKLADQAVAWYLSGHIMSGYRFLMRNYRDGDKICLFGFSRGAYTARCLAGMLYKVGLLPKDNEEQIQFAWEQYTDVSDAGKRRAEEFKATFSNDVQIDFMGVWDTVSSVGVYGRHLSFTASNRIVRVFRQALALDEHRAKFKHNPWHRPAPSASAARYDPDWGTAVYGPPPQDSEASEVPSNESSHKTPKRHASVLSDDSDAIDRWAETDVKEVWFAGCHADVGGGSVSNNTTHSLANPSLSWMVNEVIRADAPIIFKQGAFEDLPGVNPITRHKDSPASHRSTKLLESQFPQPEHLSAESPTVISTAGMLTASPAVEEPDPMATVIPITSVPSDAYSPTPPHATPGPKAVTIDVPAASQVTPQPNAKGKQKASDGMRVVKVVEENAGRDANAPMYDQLQKNRAWWLLEILPVWEYKQDKNNHWHKGLNWNFGRGREIQQPDPLFHSSVRIRQAYGYKPRATWTGEPRYVD